MTRASALLLALLTPLVACDAGDPSRPRLVVRTSPPASPGGTSRLTLEVRDRDGERVRRFTPLHGRPMHLIATTRELDDFHHVHPFLRPDGTLVADLDLRAGTPYALFAEVAPEGDLRGEQLLRAWTTPAEGPTGRGALEEGPSWDGTAPGSSRAGAEALILEALPGPLRAGVEALLAVRLEDPSGDRLPLEDWLGLPAHAIAISEDLRHFLHFHGQRQDEPGGSAAAHGHGPGHAHAGHAGHAGPTGDRARPRGPAREVLLPARFPAPGRYRLWVQLRSLDEVRTGTFQVRVR